MLKCDKPDAHPHQHEAEAITQAQQRVDDRTHDHWPNSLLCRSSGEPSLESPPHSMRSMASAACWAASASVTTRQAGFDFAYWMNLRTASRLSGLVASH